MYVVHALLGLVLWPGASREKPAPAAPVTLVDITLEQRDPDGTARAMPPDHVFKDKDIVRFRISSRVDGYLYVSNQSTSGKYSTLFPAADAGSDNHIRSGERYSVPAANEGWFEVEGPPGFEMLYFLVSPTPMSPGGRTSGAAAMPAGPLSSLTPRCNDSIFKARGECIDQTAGPAPAPPADKLPPELKDQAGSASRDIVFTKKAENTSVASTGPLAAPVIYTFRLAHQ